MFGRRPKTPVRPAAPSPGLGNHAGNCCVRGVPAQPPRRPGTLAPRPINPYVKR